MPELPEHIPRDYAWEPPTCCHPEGCRKPAVVMVDFKERLSNVRGEPGLSRIIMSACPEHRYWLSNLIMELTLTGSAAVFSEEPPDA